jgi:[protein-PII] uridylyltransferase
MKTRAYITNQGDASISRLEVITPDRPGLLAHIANIFLRFEINLVNAKIATLGERVEDIFYITNNAQQPLLDVSLNQQLVDTICSELDERNAVKPEKPLSRRVKTRP